MEYYDHFITFWLPIYRRQVFHYKFENDKAALLAVYENVMKNIHLDKIEKDYIIGELGLKFLKEGK